MKKIKSFLASLIEKKHLKDRIEILEEELKNVTDFEQISRWKPFLTSETKSTELDMLTPLEREAYQLVTGGIHCDNGQFQRFFTEKFLVHLKESVRDDGFRREFVDLVYMVSTSARMKGKGAEYTEALADLTELIFAIQRVHDDVVKK